MGWGRVEWHWHMGMSYFTSLNTQLFKNMLGLSVIILFNLIFNVNSNLAESSANCSGMQFCNAHKATAIIDIVNLILGSVDIVDLIARAIIDIIKFNFWNYISISQPFRQIVMLTRGPFREGSHIQNGRIFGKVPNSL